eukprot:TRINITY_DN21681_c0_g1_i1.p1 TRINITY_DN21681_c0_g1~~TRINITY_DN21681_c0_g1_i1.p1  ORF type:complete len:142 (+),score=37.15 TRINITY_DN21681_c0_g1_i1:59-427(+)
MCIRDRYQRRVHGITFPTGFALKPDCVVTAGLVDSTCQPLGTTVNISGFDPYFSKYPGSGNQITAIIKAINPGTPGATVPITVQSFYSTSLNQLIDSETNYATVTVTAVSYTHLTLPTIYSV